MISSRKCWTNTHGKSWVQARASYLTSLARSQTQTSYSSYIALEIISKDTDKTDDLNAGYTGRNFLFFFFFFLFCGWIYVKQQALNQMTKDGKKKTSVQLPAGCHSLSARHYRDWRVQSLYNHFSPNCCRSSSAAKVAQWRLTGNTGGITAVLLLRHHPALRFKSGGWKKTATPSLSHNKS